MYLGTYIHVPCLVHSYTNGTYPSVHGVKEDAYGKETPFFVLCLLYVRMYVHKYLSTYMHAHNVMHPPVSAGWGAR